jgi:hypothetical protein
LSEVYSRYFFNWAGWQVRLFQRVIKLPADDNANEMVFFSRLSNKKGHQPASLLENYFCIVILLDKQTPWATQAREECFYFRSVEV